MAAHANHVNLVGAHEVIGEVLVDVDLLERLLRLARRHRRLGVNVLENIAVVDLDIGDAGDAGELREEFEHRLGDKGRLEGVLRSDGVLEVEDADVAVIYVAFRAQVRDLIRAGEVPARFADFVATLPGRERAAAPVVVIKNGPYRPGRARRWSGRARR